MIYEAMQWGNVIVTFHQQLFKTSRDGYYTIKVQNCDISPTGTKTKATHGEMSQFQTKTTDLLNLTKPSSTLTKLTSFPPHLASHFPLTDLVPLLTSLSPSSSKSLTLSPSLLASPSPKQAYDQTCNVCVCHKLAQLPLLMNHYREGSYPLTR